MNAVTPSEPENLADFVVMVSDARREGFVIAKVGGEWTHTCQDCSRPARAQRKLL